MEKTMTTVRTLTGPAYWASALINGDESGMEDAEVKLMNAWLARELEPGEQVVDVARDEDGEGKEARFTWSYRLYGGDTEGGDVVDYVVLKT
jgi:hypothetical protein